MTILLASYLGAKTTELWLGERAMAALSRMGDIGHRRSERPDWVLAIQLRLNDRFGKTVLQRRRSVGDLIEERRRMSLRLHWAASRISP